MEQNKTIPMLLCCFVDTKIPTFGLADIQWNLCERYLWICL